MAKKGVYHRHASKGDSSCHIPSDKYRDGWELVYGGDKNRRDEYGILKREEDDAAGQTAGKDKA